MAEKTEIAWTDSTFNPWIGCQKVSAGCDRCYAEEMMDKRYGRVQWGPHGERVRTSEAYWRQPRRWNAAAGEFHAKHRRRQRVFCASLADVFDNQAPDGARDDLWRLIFETPELDWLLLTKRPENILSMLPKFGLPLRGPWPNVWLGTTAEDQAAYERRWPILREVPAVVHFISYEPAIGPLRLIGGHHPDWLICGGESGRGYRDMPAQWVEDIQYDCEVAEVPFFMKQMAGKRPIPDRLMLREFPVVMV